MAIINPTTPIIKIEPNLVRSVFVTYPVIAITPNMAEVIPKVMPMVPMLYKGPWNLELIALAEGKTTLASHVREGFVVKPTKERWDQHIGRVIFKMIGEGYMLKG